MFARFLLIFAFIRFLLLNFSNSRLRPSKLMKTHNFIAGEGRQSNLSNESQFQRTTVGEIVKVRLAAQLFKHKPTHASEMTEVCEISFSRSQFPAPFTTST